VTISADGQFSKIKIGGQTIRASELDAAMFLDSRTIGPAIGSIQCETALLAYGLKTALFAVSDDDGRPNLTGVFLSAEDDRLTMVCTDGHRLGKTAFPAAVSIATDSQRLNIIVPERGAELIQGIITGLATEIAVYAGDVQVTTPALGNRGQMTLTVRLIDASFPDYTRILPAPNPDKTIIVAAEDLCEAVQVICKTEISLAKQGNGKGLVRAETDGKPGFKLWSAHAQESSPDDFQLAIISSDARQQGAVKLGFNPNYWLDLCKVIEESSYSLQLIDGMSPVVIRPTDDPADLDTLFIIMPMRL
jgi:DNA polymerase-3 subunit beta